MTEEEVAKILSSKKKPHWADYEKYCDTRIERYIDDTFPRLRKEKGKSILGLGAGPGHYLKRARDYGHKTAGIDLAARNDLMDCYRFYSEKYGLGVVYENIEIAMIKDNFGFNHKFDYINSRGSIRHFFLAFKKHDQDTDELVDVFFRRVYNTINNYKWSFSISEGYQPGSFVEEYILNQKYFTVKKINKNTFILRKKKKVNPNG